MQAEALAHVWYQSIRHKKELLARLQIGDLEVNIGVAAADKSGYSRTLPRAATTSLIWSFSIGPCGVQPVPDSTDKCTIVWRIIFFCFVFITSCRVRLMSGIVTVL